MDVIYIKIIVLLFDDVTRDIKIFNTLYKVDVKVSNFKCT